MKKNKVIHPFLILQEVKNLTPFTGLISYLIWILITKMLFLTLAVYLFVSSSSRTNGFDEIHDWVSSNELTLTAASSLLFVLILRSSAPSRSATWSELFSQERLIKRFTPGFINGALIGLVVVGSLVAAGFSHFLGLYLQAEEATLTLLQIFIRTLSCIVLAYCESYLFNQRWLSKLRPLMRSDHWVIALLSLAYVTIKAIQFDLSWVQLFTLFLIQILLSYRKTIDGDFGQGAGFVAGMWVVFHPLMSLPILGNTVSGLWLVRPATAPGFPEEWSRWVSGGIGGPLSSPILQIIIFALIVRALLQNRWRQTPSRL